MKIVIEPTNKNQSGESFPRIELSLQDDLLDLDTCLIELVYPALHCIGYDTSKLEEEVRDHGYAAVRGGAHLRGEPGGWPARWCPGPAARGFLWKKDHGPADLIG